MKKLILLLAVAFGSLSTAYADNYRIDEQQLEQVFSQSTEVSFDEFLTSGQSGLTGLTFQDSKTRGGYLLRAFFCGSIALHRYYMGTSRGAMWAMYLCIPVVGGLNACVDFWWAVFDADAYQRYANNDKYIVWMD